MAREGGDGGEVVNRAALNDAFKDKLQAIDILALNATLCSVLVAWLCCPVYLSACTNHATDSDSTIEISLFVVS